MANTFVTPTKVAKRGLILLKNSMLMGRWDNRGMTADFKNPKTGNALQIRKPPRYTVTAGATLSSQDSTEYYTTIPQPSQKHVAFSWSSLEQTMEIDDFEREHMVSAVAQLANQVDSDLLALYDDIPNVVGVPGTAPNAFSTVGNAAAVLDSMGAPSDGQRSLVWDSWTNASMADALKGLFSQTLTEDAVRRGEAGTLNRFRIGTSENAPTHTTGTFSTGSTPLIAGTIAAGATSLTTDGWAVSTAVLKAGDVFTVAGVNEVNPMNRASIGKLKLFVAMADVTSDGSGLATVTILDTGDSGAGLQWSGAFQNASAIPADNAAITVWGNALPLGGVGSEGTAYRQGLAFHRDAFALCMFELNKPRGASSAHTETDPDSGISVRVVEDYDSTNDKDILRFDIAYSVKTLYPELACRIVGA